MQNGNGAICPFLCTQLARLSPSSSSGKNENQYLSWSGASSSGIYGVNSPVFNYHNTNKNKTFLVPDFEDAVALRWLAETKCQGQFLFNSSQTSATSFPPPDKRIVKMLERWESSLPVNNTSGVKGVCWDKKRNRWAASISVNKKRHTRRFESFEHAIAARCLAKCRVKTNQIN